MIGKAQGKHSRGLEAALCPTIPSQQQHSLLREDESRYLLCIMHTREENGPDRIHYEDLGDREHNSKRWCLN